MSHKRQGQLAVSGEWAKHLRPFLRRVFWKKERQAGHELVRNEASGSQHDQPSSGTLQVEVEALPMEPKRQTADDLLSIQQELVAREPIFHRPEHGTTRAAFEAMTDKDFWEVSASGRRFSRAYVLDMLEQRYSAPYEDQWKTEDFYCQQIAPENYLLTYTLHQGLRVTRRTTLWRRVPQGWVIVYHQGTVVAAS